MTPRLVGQARAIRLLVAIVAATVVSSGLPVWADADAGGESADERQLAERHAPIVRIKAQDGPCDRDGEAFAPTSVDLILGNDDVTLRQAGTADPVVTRGPTAADLFGRGEGFFLDFNGLSLEPGCVYERDFRIYSEGVEPIVYAHVVRQHDEPDQLALQYWIYWYFNDWNNTHESDWEFVQIVFDASSAGEALEVGPREVGYAQHEGGERADWADGKLERIGDRPVVYSSVGSHASYFEDTIFLGRRGTEGFGCDITTGPSIELLPSATLLPHSVDSADDEFAWLDFEGRWGERRNGPFNGPTGPALKDRWERPIDWQDGLRSSSVSIPGGDANNDTILSTFCEVVEFASDQLRIAQAAPERVIGILLGAALLTRWLAGRTVWTAVPPVPLRRRRSIGQMIRAACSSYWTSRGAILVVAALYVPVALVVGLVGSFGSIVAGQALGATLATVMTGITAVMISAYWHLAGVDERKVVEALRLARRRIAAAAGAAFSAFLIVAALSITIIGLPWAIRQAVRFQFVVPVAVTEERSPFAALRRSSELVQGRWWRTAVPVALFAAASIGVGSALQLVVLIVLSGVPLWLFLVAGSLTGGLVAPLLVTPGILLYGDAVAARDEAKVGATADLLGARS